MKHFTILAIVILIALGASSALAITGTCGPSNQQDFSSAPTTGLCDSGGHSSVSGTGLPWTWTCGGIVSGNKTPCSAYLIVNGSCGRSNQQDFSSAPTTGLCNSGNASPVSGTGLPWTWSCTGLNSGTNASCSASLIVNGSCGPSNQQDFSSAPTTGLCNSGNASPVSGTGLPWTWSCTGLNSGTNASCSASLIVNGSCGRSNQQDFSSAPTTGLCNSGNASPVSGTGLPWTWSCTGLNSGTNASCSASLIVNGSCGPSNQQDFSSAPTTGLCNSGNASPVSGTGLPWTWSCTGLNSGTNASCSASLIVNGSCGPSNQQDFSSAPTTGLCNSGNASPVSGTGLPWTWSCTGLNSGTNASCSASLIVNGSCGPSNQQILVSAPTTDLCNSGIPSTVNGGWPWTWSCLGLNAGTTATCSATPSVPTFVANTTTPLAQLTGNDFQIASHGVYYTTPINGVSPSSPQPVSVSGVGGADEGNAR